MRPLGIEKRQSGGFGRRLPTATQRGAKEKYERNERDDWLAGTFPKSQVKDDKRSDPRVSTSAAFFEHKHVEMGGFYLKRTSPLKTRHKIPLSVASERRGRSVSGLLYPRRRKQCYLLGPSGDSGARATRKPVRLKSAPQVSGTFCY